jgi:hypothetical protein
MLKEYRMKRLFIGLGLLLAGAQAQAQPAVPTQPITLTAQEYAAVLGALAERDPVLALLMRRQAEAQQAAATKPAAPAPDTPKP